MKRMSGLSFMVWVIPLIFAMPMLPSNNEAFAATIFSDNFDSYTVGTFPSSGGWVLRYNGAGNQYQHVDNTHSVSGTQSLHLEGSSCWSANAYQPVTLPSQVTLEAEVFVDQIVSGGCTNIVADINLMNPTLGTWGTSYATIAFINDGNIHAIQSDSDRTKDVVLMPYNAGAWYDVRIDIDLTARSFDVYINGVLKGSGLQILDSGMPTGIEIAAGHGSTAPVVWYDDVKVSDLLPPSNVIINPSMEAGTKAPTGWTTHNNDLTNRTGWATDYAHTGSRSLKIINFLGRKAYWAGSTVSFSEPYPTAITVGGWSRAENVLGSGGIYRLAFKVIFTDGTSKSLSTKLNFSTGSHDWQEVQKTFTLTKPIVSIRPYCRFYTYTGTVWFDDIFAQGATGTLGESVDGSDGESEPADE